MSGKGTYLGGSTIVSPWRRNAEDGWEPRSKVLGPAPKGKKGKAAKDTRGSAEARTFCPELGRDATEFEAAVVRFAREWAKSHYDKAKVPPVPEVIQERYGSRLAQYLNAIRKAKLGKRNKSMKRTAEPSNG